MLLREQYLPRCFLIWVCQVTRSKFPSFTLDETPMNTIYKLLGDCHTKKPIVQDKILLFNVKIFFEFLFNQLKNFISLIIPCFIISA